MKHETAELITNYGGELRENYSGRGMFGKSESAVVFDSEQDFYAALADALEEAFANHDPEGEEDFNAENLLALLRNHRSDSMGLSVIIY